MFNKNKLLTFAVFISLLLGNLKANLNPTYEFFIAPTLVAPSNNAADVPLPVQLQWSGSSGSVAIEIYEGCTEGGPPSVPNSIDLSGYQQTAGPITVSGISADLSGVTYNPLTNTLFMITNKSSKITETTLNGQFIRSITLNQFGDPEGIAHLGGYNYALTEERLGRVLYISIYDNTTSLNLSNMQYTQLPGISDNQGLEGVTYHPNTGDYFAVKEKTSRALFRYNGTATNPNLLPSCDIQTNSFGMSDVADIFHLGIPTGLSNLDVSDKMLIISDESNKIVEIDNSCTLYSTLNLPTSYSGGATQHEGVTMDNNGTIYVVGEPNLLYIYQNPNLDLNPSGESGLEGGTLVFSGNSGGNSYTVPNGVLAEGKEYCWRVYSGNEWSEMWSFTTEDDDGSGIAISTVSTGNDDAEEAPNGNMNLNSTDLELVQESSTQKIGMVFRDLDIPQGANIIEAKLQFTTDETSSQTTNLIIQGEDTNSASGFTSVNYNISSRTKTSAQVSWQVPAWNSIGESGSAQQSPDIKFVIQEIVNRSGFNENSNIGIIITGSGKRVAESFDGGGTAQGPKLTVIYNQDCPVAGTPCDDGDAATENDVADGNCGCEGCLPQGTVCDDDDPTTYDDEEDGECNCEGLPCPAQGTVCDDNNASTINDQEDGMCNCIGDPDEGQFIETRIAAGDDDVEENGKNGNMYLNSSDLELVYDRSYTGNQLIGLRFTNIFLPPGAEIVNAYVQFTTDEVRNKSGNMLIKAEATGNSAPYINQKYNLSSRPRTQASVAWTPPNWNMVGESGEDQRTENIAPIIQELVDRADWTGGDIQTGGVAITIMIEGNSRRVAESYNGSPQSAPLLYIRYENNGNNIVHQPEDTETEAPEDDIEERVEVSAIQNITLYPNPTAYEVNVDIQMKQPTVTQGTITLFDLSGKAYSRRPFDPQTERSVELEVAHLPQGTYIVHVQVGEHTATRKFVKK